MILIISDIHFGRSEAPAERAKERDAIDLIESVRQELVSVCLLGDVFDQYVEYKHLVPKGFLRFQACLAGLADAGIPVHYVVGNHDPWHIDYYESELGVRVTKGDLTIRHGDRTVLMSHGDVAASSALSTPIRRIVRHQISHALFRTVLPADVAYRFTRWTKRRLSSEPIDPLTVKRLDGSAARLLDEGDVDVLVYGQSHVPRCTPHRDSLYINAGSFDVDRTYVTLNDESVVVRRWNGADVFVYPFVGDKIGRSSGLRATE
ncbi:MAG: UDP-2,3-diacylglucosamine diphosphatase [Rhodothermales bacterium]|nr:UDP-2,3-diacylglucosamine diphosphatase [Rhodothermales bacterium]